MSIIYVGRAFHVLTLWWQLIYILKPLNMLFIEYELHFFNMMIHIIIHIIMIIVMLCNCLELSCCLFISQQAHLSKCNLQDVYLLLSFFVNCWLSIIHYLCIILLLCSFSDIIIPVFHVFLLEIYILSSQCLFFSRFFTF